MDKEKVIKRLLESDPVQEKLDSIVREWSYRMDSGKPQFDDKGISVLREVMKEHNIDPSLIDGGPSQLNEITFSKDKYKNEPFQPRPAGADRASQFMDTIRDEGLPEPDGLLTKTDETEDAIEVNIVSPRARKEPEETYVQDESGKTYKIVYTSIGTLNTNFLEADYDPDSISWGAAEFEVAACAGLAMENAGRSPQDVKQAFENKRADASAISELASERDFIIEVLQDSSYDWEQSGVQEIVGKFEEDAPIFDLGRFLSIALGQWEFWDEQLRGEIDNPRFILGRIREYYDAEKENENVVTEGGKANTADFIITNASADEVIQKMRSEPVAYTDDGICYFVDDENIRFVQISHKEEFGSGSQLGKFVTDFRRIFGLEDTEVLDKVVVPAQEDVLEEGVIDTVQDTVEGAAKYARGAGQTFVNMVSGGYEVFKEKVSNMLSSQISTISSVAGSIGDYFSNTSELEDRANDVIRRIYDRGLVKENQQKLFEAIVTERITHEDRVRIMKEAWKNSSFDERKEVFAPIYNPTNQRLNSILPYITDRPAYNITDRVNKFEPRKEEINSTQLTNIFATYQAMAAIENMLRREDQKIASAEDVLREFAHLQKQMVFGRTTLPLWKVSASDYKFLQDGETYEDKKVEFLKNIDEDALDLIILKIKGQPGGSAAGTWATTNVYITEDVEDEEFLYTKIELRSEGHKFSFTVSGKKSGIRKSELLE